MEKDTNYCIAAVDTPFNNSILTYKYPKGLHFNEGQLISVPLGKRTVDACVIENNANETSIQKIKDVIGESLLNFRLDSDILQVFNWVAKYYHYPLGKLMFDCLPKALKHPHKLTTYIGEGAPLSIKLNDIQLNHYNKIMSSKGFTRWLLHGVTGSGKTAIYLSVINKILQSKSVLFLLPEINLTPQLLSIFKKHCNANIYIYNSSIKNSDRYGLWKLLSEDKTPKLILGVRSAVFLPIKNLGLIIVDEEHDPSFKQEDRCPYHARDIALKRAQNLNIPIVLGTATPSLEIYKLLGNSENYLTIRERVKKYKLPTISLVDTKGKDYTETFPLCPETIEKIKSALEKNEQVLIFINRLGFSRFVQCSACGYNFFCPNCSVSLKYYRSKEHLSCNYCDYKQAYPDQCPECANMNLMHFGYGTEKVANVLKEIFPERKISRFDRDEIKTSSQLTDRLQTFHDGGIDILIGTQMVSKGHNFKKVNLVVILGIDNQFNSPNFRAHERIYQILVQVSGRSGRFGEDSEVIIQTLNEQDKIFTYIQNNSFDTFYKKEMKIRKECLYPPYTRMAMLYFISKSASSSQSEAQKKSAILQQLQEFPEVEILGPRPALIEKRVNKYTWCVLLRSVNINQLHNAISTIRNLNLARGVTLKIDVDPIDIR